MIAPAKKEMRPRIQRYFNSKHGIPDDEYSELGQSNKQSNSAEHPPADLAKLLGLPMPEEGVVDSSAGEEDGSSNNVSRTFAGLDIAELSQYANEKVDWIVQGVFSSDQPIIFGAGSKCTKTLHLIDLCVALAKPRRKNEPRRWLNRFKVAKRRKVLFITAESNKRATAKLFAKCAKAHGTTLKKMKGHLRVEAAEIPKLAHMTDLVALAADVELHDFDVVILDPLYTSLAGMDGNQLEDRGAAIRNLYLAVQPATVIISHHFTKTASRSYGDLPYLEDLNGAGLAESAGNWWLMKRNVAYASDHLHDLVVTYGGRDGQSGLVRILFDEEAWEFDVQDYAEYLTVKGMQDFIKKQKKKNDQVKFDAYELRDFMSEEYSSPKPKTTIRDNGPFSGKRFYAAFNRLIEDETIITMKYKSGKKEYDGWCLADNVCPAGDCEAE